MTVDPADVEAKTFYQHLVRAVVPRPIGWVGTRSRDGVDNVAPYSFFNAVCARPPVLMFCGSRDRDGKQKDSVTHATDTGEFVVNVVPRRLAERMNETSRSLGRGESEFGAAGLTVAESVRVKAPRVAEADVAFECAVHDAIEVGDGGPMSTTLVLGRVLLMHAADGVLGEDGQIDPAKLDAVGRLGGESYCTTRDRFDLPRPE